MQRLRHCFDGGRHRQAVGHVLPDPVGGHLFGKGNEDPVLGRARQELLQIRLALAHRHVKVSRIEADAGMAATEMHRAGKQVEMVAGQRRAGKLELHRLQRDLLPDQP
ncbi:hypothetical protein D3C72_2198140 [compost metagenome]